MTKKKAKAAALWQEHTLEKKIMLARQLTGREFAVLDDKVDVRVQTAAFPPEQLSLLRNRRQALIRQELAVFDRLKVRALEQEDRVLGWLVTDCPAEELGQDAQAVEEELSRHVTFLLWHELEIRETQRRHRDPFLYDVLYHNFTSAEEIIRIGRLWNMNFDQPHHVVVVEFDKPLPGDKHEQLLADLDNEWTRVLSARFVQPILMLLRMQLVVLFEENRTPPRSQSELAQIMADAMAKVKQDFPQIPPFSIGIGRLHYSVTEICRSFQEARQALSLGRFRQAENGITCYEDLGVLKLLSHIRIEELDDFVQETLGTLIDFDSKNNTDYLNTLEVYFQENESLPQAAERMFIHANTLRNRLKKIESILGADLSHTEVRGRFYTACLAARIVRQSV